MKIPLNITKDGLTVITGVRLNPRYRLPGLGVKIEFLVDTGSNKTFISERDTRINNIPISALEKIEDIWLAGNVFHLKDAGKAQLFFKINNDIKSIHVKKMGVAVCSSKDEKKMLVAQQVPSIIGRDFLEELELLLYYNTCKNEAYLESCK